MIDATAAQSGPQGQRIDAQFQIRRSNRLKINDMLEVVHIGADVIMRMHRGRLRALCSWKSVDPLKARRQQGIRPVFDPSLKNT